VKRAWAAQNRVALVQYVAAYIEGLRWSMVPENRSAAIELLMRRIDIGRDIAEQCYQQISDTKNGFAKDARIDLAGMTKVLTLRADFSGLSSADRLSLDRYLDGSFYREALAAL
jgi:ABC-type nitrate/sulfonate/bicarbonate transport system substrate-binding protein